ncbi:uncharacterized protein I303_102743 [Kwoniella dejecticola CBS 10117]|uniref:Dopey N-terminal domain-containing protein n=1 Tax=Kwoniella dejecticola CBS 10117 TaxID=1296121 RepID=A0AAJ8KM16_9TREE
MPSIPIISTPGAGPSSVPSSPRPESPNLDATRPRRRGSLGRLSKLVAPGRSRSTSNASQISVNQEDSGESSGSTTPEFRRRAGKVATTSLLASDARYKKFAQSLDKSLQTFESVNEWADFISFLSRLLKTLQAPSPSYPEIPRKLVVSKRLAQCLNPALPAGVHQRALDVYAYIFNIIGIEGLKRDLLIWSSGLFPFFQFATTSVRPVLINIYETYYLPLGADLRPAAKAFVLALLPGMEEETGDFFDKILHLLDKLSEAITPSFFLKNVFLNLISSPQSRLSALNYLSRRLLKPPEEDPQDVGLIIRGVSAVLTDENVLVRRHGLDLLLRILKIDEPLFENADHKDQEILIRSASSVVLQRELSLSRRVYTWLLGPSEISAEQVAYFKENSLDLLAGVLQDDMALLDGSVDGPDALRPFKIFLSLLDKWEVGGSLSERLAIPALRTIKNATTEGQDLLNEEVIGTALAVYEAIEPIVVWRLLHMAVQAELGAKESDVSRVQTCQELTEVTSVHIPVMLESVFGVISSNTLTADALLEALRLSVPLLDSVSSTTLAKASKACQKAEVEEQSAADSLYRDNGNLQQAYDRIHQDTIPRVTSTAFEICEVALSNHAEEPETLLSAIKILTILIDQEVPTLASINGAGWLSCMVQALSKLAEVHTLENVIARRLGSKPFDGPAFDAFGVLWRLTDDSMLPGEIFNIPVSMVLDALQSTDPDVQRQAETWMRLNLRSYFRVLDPILSRLLDPSIKYHQNTYLHPIDLNFVRHLVDSVSLLLKFGGQGLSKACHSTEIRQSVHPTLVTRATDAFPNDTSYLEILVSTMIRFIDTDGSSSMRKVASLFIRVQSSAIQLLQTIVSRGDTSEPQIGYVRKSIVNQLSVAVQNRHLTLQSKLLHLLHSTITAATANKALHHRRSPSLNEKNHHVRPDADFEISLVKLIVEAVSSTGNMPVLQHWVDFVLMTLPQFSTSSGLLQALSECFSQQLRYLSIHLDSVYIRSAASVNDEKLLVTEAEVVMILNTLERIVILLAGGPNAKHEDLGKQGEGEKGLLGLMSGVFTVEAPAYEIPKTEYPRYLDDAVHALLVSWTITKTTVNSSSISSKALAYGTIRSRVSKVLEKIFKVQPFGLITSCIHVWATNSKEITDSAIFECVDTLTPSAQRLVEIVCDAASGKSGRMSSEFRSDPAYLAFLEAYISRLEAPIAVQVWSTLFSFAKDLTGSVGSSAARVQLYLVLRCLTALALTVSKTSALEDRRLRRDVQDTYSKVLDLVVTNASKIAEIGLWSRLSPGTPSQDDIEKIAVEKGLDQIYDFLSSRVLPNIRSLLIDADRVNATCSGMMVSVITPALRRQHVEASILRLLLEITKIPSAIKTWRVQISDVFNDSRFFRSTTEDDVGYWKSLICGLMDSDKERFGDLLAKITAASSANIFSNREQEMSVKSLNLRRLSFVLLAAETNHHLVQLPAIQEKLVEMLRSHQVSPRVHSEVYLCLRVLMCRISPQHLTNFWPVILSELLRIFEVTMDDPPADGSEDLQLVLAACKFLDILLVIQSEDFQVHQWMFVTDTSDAVYPSENHSPEAIMDCLSILFSEGSRVTNGGKHERALVLAEQPENAPRRPRLSGIRTLDSIYQLQPFFSRASIDTFEGVFGGMGVDWDAVEDGLNREIFDA